MTYLGGRILDAKGDPLRNALVEIWQVDNNGVYLHSKDPQPRQARRATSRATAGSSPGRPANTTSAPSSRSSTPAGRRHIHFKVGKGEKELLTTQCYVKGEPAQRAGRRLPGHPRPQGPRVRDRSTSPRSKARASASCRPGSTSCSGTRPRGEEGVLGGGGAKMKTSLKVLLDAMDRIAEEHEEVGDTAVRESMREAIEKALLAPVAGYILPDEFGMFEPEGDARVKAALARFIEAARAESAGLTTCEDRLRCSRISTSSPATAAHPRNTSATATAWNGPDLNTVSLRGRATAHTKLEAPASESRDSPRRRPGSRTGDGRSPSSRGSIRGRTRWRFELVYQGRPASWSTPRPARKAGGCSVCGLLGAGNGREPGGPA